MSAHHTPAVAPLAVLALRCVQMTVPQEQVDVMLINIQGLEFNFRGRRMYDRQLSATFLETVDDVLAGGHRVLVFSSFSSFMIGR